MCVWVGGTLGGSECRMSLCIVDYTVVHKHNISTLFSRLGVSVYVSAFINHFVGTIT